MMVLRVRRGAKGVSRVLIPRWWIERWMWLIWWPLIAAWIVLPFWIALRGARASSLFLPPAFLSESGAYEFVKWAAVAVAVLALRMSITCWRHMGRHWRMGIDPSQELELLTDGPFSWARHPIYSLGMLIMLCTLVIIPTPVFLVIAIVHIVLLNLKAANEERFLREKFGAAYEEYQTTTPRLIPTCARLMAAIRGEPPSPTASRSHRFQRGTLSPFQRAMLSWEKLHPYNSVHAVRIAGTADPSRLEQAIRTACEELGIGDLHLDIAVGRFGYSRLTIVPISQLADSPQDERLLSQVAADALNAPFPPGPFSPFRWYVWNDRQNNRHWVVLAYRHVVADGAAAQMLLLKVIGRYKEDRRTASASSIPPAPVADGCNLNPIRRTGVWRCLRDVLRIHRSLRFSHKMPDERAWGDAVHVQVAITTPDETGGIQRACERCGAGLNDALLAALAVVLAEATPDRHVSRRRRKIALATILSTRNREDSVVSFDARITDAIVLIDRPDEPFSEVLQQIVSGLREWKEDRWRAAGAAAMRFWMVRRIWPLFRLPHDRRSYRKVFPVCGGVSTTVVSSPDEPSAERVERYARIVPCGPAAPLALAVTMQGGRLALALTHRLSSKSDEQAAGFLARIREKLTTWAGEFSASPLVTEQALTAAER